MFNINDYRIWDKKEKRWCTKEYDVAVAYDCVSPYAYYIVENHEDGSMHIFSDEEEKARFDLELYIGFTDYDGNKIYEGDIVKGVPPSTEILMVICNNRYAKKHALLALPIMVNVDNWHEGLDKGANVDAYRISQDSKDKTVNVRIKGNIHENEELLHEA